MSLTRDIAYEGSIHSIIYIYICMYYIYIRRAYAAARCLLQARRLLHARHDSLRLNLLMLLRQRRRLSTPAQVYSVLYRGLASAI